MKKIPVASVRQALPYQKVGKENIKSNEPIKENFLENCNSFKKANKTKLERKIKRVFTMPNPVGIEKGSKETVKGTSGL